MDECLVIPKTRRDIAKFLKENDYNILKTLYQLEDFFELDKGKRNSLQSMLQRIRENSKKSKKSIDTLIGDWWDYSLNFEPNSKKRCVLLPVEVAVSSVIETKATVSHRKHIDDISWKQQRSRLSSVLEAIQVLAQFEQVSEVKIATLALQAISNLSNCRQAAKVSKFIANESFPGQFGYFAKKDLDLNKSLFLLDMLEIGKRKYTQLGQHLISSDIQFPAYQRVIDHRNTIILRSSLQLYPNPAAPIGLNVSY